MTMKLVSYFGRINQIRRDRPLPHEVLMGYVPCVFSSDKYESCSDRYTYITTITILESLQREGSQHSLPARLLYETRNTLNTCYACFVLGPSDTA